MVTVSGVYLFSLKFRAAGSAILAVNWGFACLADCCSGYFMVSGDGGADEVECLPLFAGGFGAPDWITLTRRLRAR